MIKTDTLPQFLRNKVAENDAFGLVEGLCQLLRSSPTEKNFSDLAFYLSLS